MLIFDAMKFDDCLQLTGNFKSLFQSFNKMIGTPIYLKRLVLLLVQNDFGLSKLVWTSNLFVTLKNETTNLKWCKKARGHFKMPF